ncbi:MAG: ATP-binding protein, partial [Planctomycetes bacterium]|nr:ATP-binding protein [Planctomycetota bacterium]
EALAEMPVVVVTGLRQAGKSTFLQCEPRVSDRAYLSLDDFAQLESARRDPEGFVDREGPVTIDEAQRCPELLTAIKRAVDRDRRPGRFLLSGSASFALLEGITESLAGRAIYLSIHPFTRRELRGRLDGDPFLKKLLRQGKAPRSLRGTPIAAAEILTGGLPPVALGLVRRADLWFKGYEQTYLERDVRELSRLGDLIAFRQLLHLAALRTGQVLNVSELARDAKLNGATTSRYLSVLEASFVVRRLPPFLSNRASRLIKSPKIYVTDSGLAAHLAGATESDLLGGDPLGGPLLETYVAQNIAAIIDASWPEARLFFWHVQGRHEVDFVVEEKRDVLALEVKAASRWGDRDLAGLRAFLHKTPRCRAAVLAYMGPDVVRLEDRLWAVPIDVALG